MEFQKKDQASVIDKLNNRIIDLEQQLESKDEFLSHAVHELKGSIHNIYFLIDYLEGYWLNIIPSEQLKHIRTIKGLSEYLKGVFHRKGRIFSRLIFKPLFVRHTYGN